MKLAKEFPELQGDRINLRKPMVTDSIGIFRLRSDESVAKYLDRKLQSETSEAKEFLTKILQGIEEQNWLYWIITKKISDEFLGTICLWNFSDDGKTAEVGFEMLPERQGRGYASEALSSVLRYGFYELSMDFIEGFVHPENRNSIELMKKHGFTLDREFEDESVLTGGKIKFLIYQISKEKYYLSS